MSDSLDDRFAASMGRLLGPDFPTDIGLAVSGGGDSMALLALTHNWTRRFGLRLHVVTVDHGLRPESAAEAQMVAQECALLGWPHETLSWRWDGQGNVQNAAREARRALLDQWRGKVDHILMGHTQNDVAETFLMRLARKSGVDGLAAIEARHRVQGRQGGFWIVRPLLGETRADLRHYLRVLQVPWVDDPSNDDPGYDRVRMRHLLPDLSKAGLSVPVLAEVAEHLGRARTALERRARDVSQQLVTWDQTYGQVAFDRDGLRQIEEDTQTRLVSDACRWLASTPYRPRLSAVRDALHRAQDGGHTTLHGCVLFAEGAMLHLFREPAAVDGKVHGLEPDAWGQWDTRWHIRASKRATLRALGETGWRQLTDPTPPGFPRHRAARALPALFDGDKLVACPGLEPAQGWSATFSLRPMAVPSTAGLGQET